MLSDIKNTVKGKFPDAQIILYGSRAKGIARDDSDWDLLILLNKEKITPEIEESVTYPLYDLEIELGEVISPMVYSLSEWNSKYKITPFYYNVMKEGIQL
ncbi:nucleotidyltransferase domain-containing protein [Marinilabiliaceae bacterium A049]|nr:nucleotidyltransferase domain-containing protein [Marinilabiliaceae bacterium A049]